MYKNSELIYEALIQNHGVIMFFVFNMLNVMVMVILFSLFCIYFYALYV
jgi:hypothetical protein